MAFYIAEHNGERGPSPDNVYRIVSQTLGIAPSGQPYGGPRYAAGRDLSKAGWTRVYDVVLRLAREFYRVGRFEEYRDGVNAALAGNGVVWDLNDQGRLERVLPANAQQHVSGAIQELAAPEYGPARQLFNAARDAYDDLPRRDRDACSNAFDALESVAKTKYGMAQSTFGKVVAHVRQAGAQNQEVLTVLESINTLRNRNFGHGMTTPFALTSAQVDFTYLTCIAGVLLFARTP